MKNSELTDKYYRGETTLEEEKELRRQATEEIMGSPEKEMFGYFNQMGKVPAGIEDEISAKLPLEKTVNKPVRRIIYRISAIAASVTILLGIYLGYRNSRNPNYEDQFFVMEQALHKVSENIKPTEQEEMLVLWVNKDVEIIIK